MNLKLKGSTNWAKNSALEWKKIKLIRDENGQRKRKLRNKAVLTKTEAIRIEKFQTKLMIRESRLEKDQLKKRRKQSAETETEKQSRLSLEKNRNYKKRKFSDETTSFTNIGQREYLKKIDIKNYMISEQNWAKLYISKFHKSIQFSTYQCNICKEAWPFKSKPRSPNSYIRVFKDVAGIRNLPKSFQFKIQ